MENNTIQEGQEIKHHESTNKKALLNRVCSNEVLTNQLNILIESDCDWNIYVSEYMSKEPDVFSVGAFREWKLNSVEITKSQFVSLCKQCIKDAIEKLTLYPLGDEDVLRARQVLHNDSEKMRFYDEYKMNIGSNPIKLLHPRSRREW